jgi:hypothetical protein
LTVGKEISLPTVNSELLRGLPWRTRLQGAVYGRVRRLPFFEPIFQWVTPQWDVRLRKRCSSPGERGA